MSFQMRGAFSQLCTIIQTFSYCSAKASSKPGLAAPVSVYQTAVLRLAAFGQVQGEELPKL